MYSYLAKLFVALVFVLHGTTPAATHVIVDNNRILYGSNATKEDTGYVVYLIIEKQQNRTLCGGSIINEQTILTAAQCIASAFVSDVKVYAGTKKFSWYPDSPSMSVAAVHVHPDYNPESFDNDIALVRLVASLTFNNNIRAIKLAEAGVIEEMEANVFGWGRTETDQVSSLLLYTYDFLLGRSFCKDMAHTTDRMLCGLIEAVGAGDTGGPLVQDDKVIGIVSHESPGDLHFSVYTRVAALRPWVDQTLAEHYHEKL